MNPTAIDELAVAEAYTKLRDHPPMTGENLGEWIKAQGLTQKQAAELLDRGARQLRNWIAKANEPVPKHIQLACAWIGFQIRLERRNMEQKTHEGENQPLPL